MVKLNSAGELEWDKNYGNTENDGGSVKILQTQDGGYAFSAINSAVGGDVGFNNGSVDYWLVKIDGAGTIEWEQSYGGGGIDQVYTMDLTNDGGFVLAGYSNTANGDVSTIYGKNDIWVIRLDANGNILWNRNYGGTDSEFGFSIDALDDGRFIIFGFTSL